MKFLLILILIAPLPAQEEIRYSYDKNGRLTRVEYSNGRAIAYTYDPNGNLVRREFIAPGPAGEAAPAPEGKPPLPAKSDGSTETKELRPVPKAKK